MDSEMNPPPEDSLDRPDIIRVVPENAALKEEEAKPPGDQEERRQMPHRPPSLFCRHHLQDRTTGGHGPHNGPELNKSRYQTLKLCVRLHSGRETSRDSSLCPWQMRCVRGAVLIR